MKWHTKELEMMSVGYVEKTHRATTLFLSVETFDFPLRWFVAMSSLCLACLPPSSSRARLLLSLSGQHWMLNLVFTLALSNRRSRIIQKSEVIKILRVGHIPEPGRLAGRKVVQDFPFYLANLAFAWDGLTVHGCRPRHGILLTAS